MGYTLDPKLCSQEDVNTITMEPGTSWKVGCSDADPNFKRIEESEKDMKQRVILLLSYAAMTTPVFAAGSPFDGAWKLNSSLSTWSNGELPQNMSLTIQLTVSGDELTYKSLNDTNKEKPIGSSYTVKLDGKPYPLPGSTRYNQVAVQKTASNELEILELKDGDVIVGAIWIFSPDGKHMKRWGVGKAPDGKSKAYVEYFEKQ